ncbi:hypothetical protein HPT29_021275 [Microvirga terrae]|uniref:Sulfatase-like hydrolase/transferase n=1 Tax=Microvirga terrae TaxID=2740529 RepID=A0ABY5RRZ3_9HYPH|nr:hypothetical protein [Microvirga terrae]UVF18972.1 hypothetical protein HPT29_021275 [Microvirga terrae]
MHRFTRQSRAALPFGSCDAALTLPGAAAVAQQPKPSVVFILADTVGSSDPGYDGGGRMRRAPTPRIDQNLAARFCGRLSA